MVRALSGTANPDSRPGEFRKHQGCLWPLEMPTTQIIGQKGLQRAETLDPT